MGYDRHYKGEKMKDAAYGEFIDKLRMASDIVDVIGQYIPLKKKGRNFWGCCPFHHEKTPSFSVAPDKGFFYCFGCQSGGNIFTFLMKVENISFADAAKVLAQKLNIPLPEQKKSARDIAIEQEKRELYRINELAKDFFYACLTKTRYGRAAQEYLKLRGITEAVIEQFQIGFSPPGWDKLLNGFRAKGIAVADIQKAGLIIEKPSGGSYDRFRSRIMFPISDEHGKVIGFGGRVLDDSQPKYLNSPETTIFNKRYLLYGLHAAKQNIRSLRQVVVVEGYLDAITAHAAGIINVVASLGTAFTVNQARILMKYADEIIFAYDSDAAGQIATLRALEIVRSLGVRVRVVSIPEGKDPDEFIRKQGADAFRKLIDSASNLLEYQVEQAFKAVDYSNLEGKITVVNRLVPALAAADNAVEVNAHITRIAQRLMIDETSIRAEVRRFLAVEQKDKNINSGKAISAVLKSNELTVATTMAERLLIRYMYEDAAMIPYVETQLPAEEFHSEERCKIAKAIFDLYHAGKDIICEASSSEITELTGAEFSQIMLMDVECVEVVKQVDDCIKMVHLTHLKFLYEQHRLRADELERMGDSRFLQELAESQRIQHEIKKIQSA